MTYAIQVQLTKRAYHGLLAAANQQLSIGTIESLAQNVLENSGKTYANLYKVGLVTPAELILRLAPELSDILSQMQSNSALRDLVQILTNREELIPLDSPELIEGLNLLASMGLITLARITEVIDYNQQPGDP